MLSDTLRYYCERKEKDKINIILFPWKYFLSDYLFAKPHKTSDKTPGLRTLEHHIRISAIICDLFDHTNGGDFCALFVPLKKKCF